MGIFFTPGETKKRPGIYQRYENVGTPQGAGAINGICAAVFKCNWGPQNKVQVLDSLDQAVTIYGKQAADSILSQLFYGGAEKVIAVRIGSQGEKGTATLADAAKNNVITLTLKHQGNREFQYIVREYLGDAGKKELVLLEDQIILERFVFPKNPTDSTEADALLAAIANSAYLTAVKTADYTGAGTLALITQGAFTGGTAGNGTVQDYQKGLTLLETQRFNTLSVDTTDTAVTALLSPFMDKIYQNGKMAFAVIGADYEDDLETRMAQAALFNDYKVIFVGNGWKDASGNLIAGEKAAARIAGMVASIPANESITHRTISGAAEPMEYLTNSEYEACIDHGMLVCSVNSLDQVWVDAGITTLTTVSGNDDEGWKKIKRAKIRFELMTRASDSVAPMVGVTPNDEDGRAAIIQVVQGICNSMVAEEKLLPGACCILDAANPPRGDSAWFSIIANDIDSIEKVYLTFKFSFSSNN
ncbi:MAG: phage tail protein [Peptococcaceae bacterium]|jgi:hypothetical protein|nr:phage tail protein [Peptococcaceae bacterium]